MACGRRYFVVLDELNPVFSQVPAPVLRLQFSTGQYSSAATLFVVHMASNAAAEWVVGDDPQLNRPGHAYSMDNEKNLSEEKHLERVVTSESNLVYDDVDEEPELHARTYIALAAMFLLNLVQVVALQGPPAVVGDHGAAWAGRLD